MTLEVAFRQPVLLPTTVEFKYSEGKQINFALFNKAGSKIHMTGAVTL